MKIPPLFFAFLLTLVSTIFLPACDNNTDTDADSPIISEWEFTNFKFDVEVTDASLKDSVTNFLKNSTRSEVGTYTLRANGTYTKRLTPWCGTGLEYPKDYFRDGKYVFKGDSLYLDGSKTASLYLHDGNLNSNMEYGWNKKSIAEQLKIDEVKIVKAKTISVYRKDILICGDSQL